MPKMRITPDLEMVYELDDYTNPWEPSDVVLFLHGVSDNGGTWFGWVPHFARRFRTLRPDMRGFGRSTAMPTDYRWSMDRLRDDYLTLLDALKIERVHVVGAKIGGMISLHLAATCPDRILSATVMSAPVSAKQIPTTNVPRLMEAFETGGVVPWVWANHDRRLGPSTSAAHKKWWGESMIASTPLSTLTSFIHSEHGMEIAHELPDIRCPVLAITTEGSTLGSADQIRAWQQHVKHAELAVLPGDAFHVAAAYPDAAAEVTLAFMLRGAKPKS